MNKALLPAIARLLAFSAAGLSTGAHAAWVEYDRDANMTQYYESAIARKGGIATVTVLSNAKLAWDFANLLTSAMNRRAAAIAAFAG